ncbi:B-cell receptor CD22-like isoform X2 [Salarias fasciatus]|uniref:B-cell receptor CD22-like isoform X2 n=1 Tax=Salarias fasciatus TaxID=181472 RepID=UPI001176A731|nr:B-cell receptor CD22-like isoform X2 [Salarias fasciatus]
MRVELQTWILTLLFLSGVFCSIWKVEYQHEFICAVKGSAVSIPCLFYSSDNQKVQRVLWGHVNAFGKYMVMFNKAKRLPVEVAPVLKVVDLTISMTKSGKDEAIKEGDSVKLTCVNSCDDSNASSAFTWFRNGESIYEGPFLHFRNMSPSVSGNYTCSLKTLLGTISRAVIINVEYGPKNTSVIFRPPGDADGGGNFTLTCSSDANPPVENYTWFKTDGEEISPVGHQPTFSPADGGQYFCRAANKHGSQISSTAEVNMKKDHETISREMLIIPAAGTFLIVITIILLIRLCKKRLRPANTDSDEDESNTDYVNWLESETIITDLSEWGNDGVYNSSFIILNRRRDNMEQHADQDGTEQQTVIYSTVNT